MAAPVGRERGLLAGRALLVKNHFPSWRDGASACLLGTVMSFELIGPVLFRKALLVSGEARGKEAVAGAARRFSR